MIAATFHSVCARLLREHAGLFGRSDTYTIYDQADLRRVIERCSPTAARRDQAGDRAAADNPPRPSSKPDRPRQEPPAHPRRYGARRRRAARRRRVARGEPNSSAATRGRSTTCSSSRCGCCASTPQRLAHLRERWRWLVVDEMQDTNEAQAALVHLLAGPDGNVTVVGDDDQAIYRFRSAQPRNILRLRRALPATASCWAQLPLARRDPGAAAPASPTTITGTAKPLSAMRGAGGRIKRAASRRPRRGHLGSGPDRRRARGRHAADGDPRARPHRVRPAPVQPALAAAGIPHRVLGSLGLYERAEVRDALAYLALLANPRRRAGLPTRRATPRRGVGTATPAASSPPRANPRGDLITACANAHVLDDMRSQRRATSSPRSATASTRPRAARAGRSLGHVVVATRHARRRPGRPPPAAPRPLPAPGAAPRRRTRARGPALAVPRRPGLRDRPAPPPRSPAFLEHAAGLHAEELRPAKTAASPSPPSTAPKAPSRTRRCCSPAKSSCCRPGARCEPPTPRTSTRNGACSTSPPPAPRTSSPSPARHAAAGAPPPAPRAF